MISPAHYKMGFSSFVLGIILVFQAGAQLNPDFSSDITSGCNPIVVAFYDQTTGGNVTSWSWDFGNGTTSNLENPKTSYTSPGYYKITLTVSDGTDNKSIVKTNYIRVFKNPDARISIQDRNGCVPFNASFKDASVLGDTMINQWTWDFGNGASSASQNPEFEYTIAGSYAVSLQVMDANGCSDAVKVKNAIEAYPLPQPGFTAHKTDFCDTPAVAFFSNSSKGFGILKYNWSFGDFSNSTLANPSHTYNQISSFHVKLLITDQHGCSDSLIRKKYIRVNKVKAQLDIADTVCYNEKNRFRSTSIGAEDHFWLFGDGYSSTSKNPRHAYTDSGLYQVSLYITDGKSCVDSAKKEIYIQRLTADFDLSPNYSCEIPLDVSYTNKSTGADLWKWDFGDGTTSTVEHPRHTFTQQGNMASKLVVQSYFGCQDSLIKDSAVVITLPKAGFTMDQNTGCVPLKVQFTDKSISNEKLKSWFWDFDDGSTSSQTSPGHSFINHGEYKVKLIIQNDSGCIDSIVKTIKVGMKPDIDFTQTPDSACAFDSILFTDLSTNPSGQPNDFWQWTFGDGLFGGGQNTFHQHFDTGYMEVRLIVGYHGCYDTLVRDSAHYIMPPVQIISTDFSCDKRLEYLFIQNELGVDHWEIHYGDGKSDKNILTDTIKHVYGNYGTYDFNTIAYNDANGCTWKNKGEVIVDRADADFLISKDHICTGDSLIAWPDSHNTFGRKGGYYDFGDQNSGTKPIHAYEKSGVFKITRMIEDLNGCPDSAYKYVTVYDLNADFMVDKKACRDMITNFQDASTSDTTLVTWNWDFDNGKTAHIQSPGVIYWNDGKYSPELTIVDALGCTNTELKKNHIEVIKPLAEFDAENRNLCAGDTLVFINLSKGENLKFYWDFGDGSQSKAKTPAHEYQHGNFYDVQLIVEDTFGCLDTFIWSDFARVQDIPVAGFRTDTNNSICFPLLVHFYDTTFSQDIIKWRWEFGDDQSYSLFKNPVHNYTNPGNYDVKLVVETSFGCKDSVFRPDYIKVRGPRADFVAIPDTICIHETVLFVLTENKNIQNLDWDFGDGNVVSRVTDSIIHAYSIDGFMYPKIIFVDSSGICRKFSTDTLYVSAAKAGFEISENESFVPYNALFTDLSRPNTIKWKWNFGDGSDTTGPDVTHFYDSVGEFQVSLVVTNHLGCVDTFKDIMIIKHWPYVIDMPTAFTPDAQNNNEIKLQGYGRRFKELVEFKIYNRWGEVVFETNDPSIGWDGTYKGKPQNTDTYVYVVKVITNDDEIKIAKGYISLIR